MTSMSLTSAPITALHGDAADILANRIAATLEREIIASGWQVGQALGSEAQLVERFGVSRWVVREALAITERNGLTHMRRGRGGGLYVSAPAESVVETTMRNYLLLAGIDSHTLVAMRRGIDGIAARLAIANTSEKALDDARSLLKQLAHEDDLGKLNNANLLYQQILAMADNRLLQIFGQVLSQLTFGLGICLGSRAFRAQASTANTLHMGEIRRRHLECLVGADLCGAMQAAGAAYDDLFALYADSPFAGKKFDLGDSMPHTQAIAEQIVDAYPCGNEIRRVDSLVLRIQLDILRLNYAPGDPIAPEKILMDRYGVGRNVLREGIRILQRDHIVAAAEGRQGGLCVAVPTPDNIVRSNLLLLQFMRVQAREVEPIAQELLAMAAEHVARRVRCEGVQCAEPALQLLAGSTAANGPFPRTELLRTLGELSGNAILDLFTRTLAAFQFEQAAGAPTASAKSARTKREASSLGAQLATALTGGDAPMSRRYAVQLAALA